MVSQQWLDKKRAELNPYLLLGAPIVSISSLPLFNWLCQTYTWSGACLISAGITLNCVIVILLFDRNLDNQVDKCQKVKSGYPLERHKDYKPKPAETLSEMFNNPDLRSHSNLKLLLSTQVINLSIIITPIKWVTKIDLKLTSNQTIFSLP